MEKSRSNCQANRNDSIVAIIDGSMHFTASTFLKMGDTLRNPIIQKQYKYIALAPEASRITKIVPQSPIQAVMVKKGNKTLLAWQAGANNHKFVIYRFTLGELTDFSNSENIYYVTTDSKLEVSNHDLKNYVYAITALSQTQTESTPIQFISH